MTIPLSELKIGQFARIKSMEVDDTINQRLLAFGLTPGERVCILHMAPLKDPIAIAFCGQKLMIRRKDAQYILVELI